MTTQEPEITPLSRRRANIPERKAQTLVLLEHLRTGWAAVVILLLLVSLMRYMIWQGGAHPIDAANTPLLSGTARVINKLVGYNKTGAAFTVAFRIEGQTVLRYNANEAKWQQTQVGTTVPVTYRKGRNATIYVDDWQTEKKQEPDTRRD